jgi:hypothetical protein
VGGYIMVACCFVLVSASYFYFLEKYEQREGNGTTAFTG